VVSRVVHAAAVGVHALVEDCDGSVCEAREGPAEWCGGVYGGGVCTIRTAHTPHTPHARGGGQGGQACLCSEQVCNNCVY
jgi:hypothetical protein